MLSHALINFACNCLVIIYVSYNVSLGVRDDDVYVNEGNSVPNSKDSMPEVNGK